MTYKKHFLDTCDEDKLKQTVEDIVTDPKLTWERITGQRGFLSGRSKYVVDGFRSGLWIRVVIEPEERGIVTAFPLDVKDGEQYSHPPISV